MRFIKKDEENFDMNFVSMVDIVFLLLIFFMVSTAFVDFTKRMEIQLPEAKAGAASGQTRAFTIEISQEGKIFLDGKETPMEGIEEALRREPEARRSVVIRADRKLFYGLAVEIMGICRAAGINDIGLAVL